MADQDKVFDCQSCGACCVSDFDAPDYVYVSDEESDLLCKKRFAAWIYEERTYGKPALSMRTRRDEQSNCRCIALQGTVGEQVSCAIYDLRPEGCRKFEPGSAVCETARRIAFGVSDR